MFALLIVFGVIGLCSDLFLRWLRNVTLTVGPAVSASSSPRRSCVGRRRVQGVPPAARQSTVVALDGDRPARRPRRAGLPRRRLGLRQVDAAVDRRRARGADRRRGARRRRAWSSGPAPTAAWCSRATRCTRGRPSPTNIAFGLEVGPLAAGQAPGAGRRAARRSWGSPSSPTRCPSELSGGMRQRVAIARALGARARRAAARRAVRRARRPDQAPHAGLPADRLAAHSARRSSWSPTTSRRRSTCPAGST